MRDEASHGPDGVLDRDVGVDPMLIVEVDDVDAEALEARLTGLLHIFRPPIDGISLAIAAHLAEFARQHDLVAPPLDCSPHEFLIVPPAIHVGGIEVVDADVDRMLD